MKFVRFQQGAAIRYGVLEGENIRIVEGDIFAKWAMGNQVIKPDTVKLLAPCAPSKAVCIGLNYHGHAKEMKIDLPKEPLMFLKPSTCLANPGGPVEYPPISQNLHFEAELAVVIGKQARHVPAAAAREYILVYTCANDVTARDLQMKDGQWTRGKSFDTFMPLGPCIATDIDPANTDLKLYLNGEVKQASNTGDLIFKVEELVAFASQVMTLHPGDVILTGTPAGVGPMQVGDTVAVELAGIGRLENTIVKG
jgi:2-keto-4-pentenoate hydratase/2-oxohepta-3-ene-1,7-dioic acid hydratase in catechol pathway